MNVKRNHTNEKGATFLDYALMVALVAILALLPISMTGQSVRAQFLTIQEHLEVASSAGDAGTGRSPGRRPGTGRR